MSQGPWRWNWMAKTDMFGISALTFEVIQTKKYILYTKFKIPWILLFVCMLNHFSRSNSLRTHGLQPARLLCPWDSPGKNTGVGCRVFLQGIFPTQGSNPGLPHCRQILYQLGHQGSSLFSIKPENQTKKAPAWGCIKNCRVETQKLNLLFFERNT